MLFIGINGCILLRDKDGTRLDIADNQLTASDPNLLSSRDEEYFEIVGYGELEINVSNRNLNLINSKDNNVYLKFAVFYDDELLYSTKLIEPGKMEQYDVYSNLDAGKHTLTYSIDVIDMKTKVTTWSGIKQEQEIFIKK